MFHSSPTQNPRLHESKLKYREHEITVYMHSDHQVFGVLGKIYLVISY